MWTYKHDPWGCYPKERGAPVETLSSAGGSWVTEANGLNVARYRCVGAPRPRVLRDECTPLGDQRLVSGKIDWPGGIMRMIASAVMNNNHVSNEYQWASRLIVSQ